MIKIHYFFDPMCGWCYGAGQLMEIVEQHRGFELEYHPGGMIAHQAIDSGFRQHIVQADKRIQTETGSLFGEDYLARVVSDAPLILDSFMPIRALYVASQLAINPMAMLKAIQRGHYQQGLEVEKLETLKQLALALGADETKWVELMNSQAQAANEWVEDTHQLMAQYQVQGYPTLLAQIDQQMVRIPHSRFYRKPNQWQQWLDELASTQI